MRIGKVEISFHRTVRVANGRSPSNLPPSLGRATVQKVESFRASCPDIWDDKGLFIPLHDTEALWLQFSASSPAAIIVGAGGVNALTGEPLGTKLESGNYVVAPPQPWLDGWKSKDDGCVYQFIATPYQKGEGLSVGEQLLGEKSETGGIGIAVFDSNKPLQPKASPLEGWSGGAYDSEFSYSSGVKSAMLSASPTRGMRSTSFSEMGIGKGGKITQKIYPDPHGLDCWNESPTQVSVVYLVNAEVYAEITGVTIPKPIGHESYTGAWYGLKDETEGDAPGSSKFDALKSVFPGDTSNV